MLAEMMQAYGSVVEMQMRVQPLRDGNSLVMMRANVMPCLWLLCEE
jgi:hypothetical protein